MSDEKRYLYYINPSRPIKNINSDIRLIRAPHSYYLTKEEVSKCLGFGHIYRRFSNEDKYELVNKYNLDRLHNDRFISEKEYEALNPITPIEKETVVKVEEVIDDSDLIDETETNTNLVSIEDDNTASIENNIVEAEVIDISESDITSSIENIIVEVEDIDNSESDNEYITDESIEISDFDDEESNEDISVVNEVKINTDDIKIDNHNNYHKKKKHH